MSESPWEEIATVTTRSGRPELTTRLRVPGGYIYRVTVEVGERLNSSMVYVPDPKE